MSTGPRTTKRILPFGRLFHFLFGTAKDKNIKSMKQDIKRLYDNQISQSKVLNDVISIANISRGLINANILKINQIISTITCLNDMMDSIMNQLRPFFLLRESFYCTLKCSYIMWGSDHFWTKCTLTLPRLKNTSKFVSQENWLHHYWPCTPKTGALADKQTLACKAFHTWGPHCNIWHYYRFLTVNPVIHGGKPILMIRIPLTDLDSVMNLYKIYNFPIYNHDIGKSLQYILRRNQPGNQQGQPICCYPIRQAIHPMYFGRQTFLCLEYGPLLFWHKSMVCDYPVFQRECQNWWFLQTYPFHYYWTQGQLPWPGPMG